MRILFFVSVCCVLAACKQANVQPSVEAAMTGNTVAENKPTAAPAKPAKQLMLEDLLAQAERAMKDGRITQPDFDNAYDKYRAASLIDPDNAQAQAGMDGVQLTLVALTREELGKGRLQKAGKLYNSVAERFPNSPLTRELHGEIRTAIAAREQARLKNQKAIADDPHQHLIPTGFLGKESDEAKAWFGELAQLIQQEDASILIYARSDAEGRKIYRLLKAGVTDYLIRGDIRVHGLPRVEFLEPLP